MSPPVLEARNLVRRFSSIPVVRGVSFALRRGEVTGYLGPNGSGKSVTLRMLTGLLQPNSGRVLVDGRTIEDDLVSFRRRLGYVPEEPHLYTFLSGREYLELVGRLRELPERFLDAQISRLMDLFEIGDAADQSLSSYSKGMKQKVLIIAAMLHDPDVLIFDEPDSGLDATTTLVFKHLLRELAGRGKCVLYSSHVLEMVEQTCDRVMVLHQGQIVADDSVSGLRNLVAKQTLSDVFSALVVKEHPQERAHRIADAAGQRP